MHGALPHNEEFLRVEKASKQKLKGVDAKHLFFYVVRGLRSSHCHWLRGLSIIPLVCKGGSKGLANKGGNDAIFFGEKWV